MQSFASAPRTLCTLLALLVAAMAFQAIAFSSNPVAALLWPALVAALSLSALLGSRKAATGLKYFTYVTTALLLWNLLRWPGLSPSVISNLVVAALSLLTGLYLSRSGTVARFYSKEAADSPNAV